MKKLANVFAILLIVMIIAACAPAAPTTVAPTELQAAATTDAPTEAPTAAPTLTAQEEWLKSAGLDVYAPEKQDWTAIEAAAKAEGTVVVYSNSSRIADAAAVFAEKYPDIKIEGLDMGTAEVLTKVREEQAAGAFNGDVWLAGGGPDVEGEMVPSKFIWKFIPDDLLSVIPEDSQTPIVTSNKEMFGWVYNTELNKSCPISNWWELTNPEWKGKIYLKDPMTSAEDLGMLISATVHADEFAAAYKELYGKDPVLDADTPDAGWLWIKKFAQNSPVGEPGSDETWAAMATPGMKDNAMGWLPLSKYRNVTKGKAVFAPCEGLKPMVGVQKRNYLAVINQAPHPNAAKLFIKFALSEEGFKPWNQVGQYSSRTDTKPIEEAAPFVNLPVWNFDNVYVYNNLTKYHDFYALALLSK